MAGDGFEEELRRKNIVAPDEDVVMVVKQKRLRNPLYPYYVVLTGRQVVKYSPRFLSHETETRSIGDVDDVDVETGLVSSRVTIESHGLDDFVLEGLPKYMGDGLRNQIQKLKEKKQES